MRILSLICLRSAVGFAVLVALGGSGCGSSLAPATTVDAGVDISVRTVVSDAAVECAPYLTQTGEDTGLETCSNGNFQRTAAVQCPWPPMGTPTDPCPTTGAGACASDDECAVYPPTEPKGYCAQAHNLANYCGCFMGCREDADCGPGFICQCGSSGFGQCAPATCASNADCGAGLACVRTLEGTPGGTCNPIEGSPWLFVCQTPADTCRASTDCIVTGTPDPSEIVSPICLYDGTRLACGAACRGI
jgi:hypothetical protein